MSVSKVEVSANMSLIAWYPTVRNAAKMTEVAQFCGLILLKVAAAFSPKVLLLKTSVCVCLRSR